MGGPCRTSSSIATTSPFWIITNGLVRSGSSPCRYMPVTLRMLVWSFFRVLSTNRVSNSSIRFSALMGMGGRGGPVMAFGWIESELQSIGEELILSGYCDLVVVAMMQTCRQETQIVQAEWWSKCRCVPADWLAREVHRGYPLTKGYDYH